MKKSTKKILLLIPLIIILLIFSLFLIRALSKKELDDINPLISCEKDIIEKSNLLWIIPKLNNIPITENKTWCIEILALNKTLGLHGVKHNFEEFGINQNNDYIQEGIDIFEECFGFKPKMFKPPQLKISNQNKQLIKNNNLTLKNKFNQITHKVYHCNDSLTFSNKFIDKF